jgi:hypothetical protein
MRNATKFHEHAKPHVKEGKWLNLVIGRQRPASELLSSGISVALEIATDFNTLLPIYLNKEPR